MRRILFVDDEQQVLDALRNLLRRQRKQWEMAFALSGQQALDEMKKAPFDAIISDMRMPEMDGCVLLEHVRALYPNTARIVLSGHAERDAVVRALAVAHQFLSKPCDGDTLRTAIERTCRVHDALRSEAVVRIVGAMESAPTMPKSYFELAKVVASPVFEVTMVSDVFECDAAMNTRALTTINSPLVGLPQRATSVHAAAMLLGVDWARFLALGSPLAIAMDSMPVDGSPFDQIRLGTVLAARIARSFFRDPQKGQDAFTAALAHGVGRMVAAVGVRDTFIEVERLVRAGGRRAIEVEREKLGATYGEIGAHMLAAFGVQFSIVEAVAFHDEPGKVTEGPRELLAAVHAAHAFVKNTEPDAAFFRAAKLTEELPQWRALALAELAERRAA